MNKGLTINFKIDNLTISCNSKELLDKITNKIKNNNIKPKTNNHHTDDISLPSPIKYFIWRATTAFYENINRDLYISFQQIDKTTILYGVATCSEKDQFVKYIGRKISEDRLKHNPNTITINQCIKENLITDIYNDFRELNLGFIKHIILNEINKKFKK